MEGIICTNTRDIQLMNRTQGKKKKKKKRAQEKGRTKKNGNTSQREAQIQCDKKTVREKGRQKRRQKTSERERETERMQRKKHACATAVYNFVANLVPISTYVSTLARECSTIS